MITTKNLIEVRDSIIEKSIEGLRQYGHVEPVAFLLIKPHFFPSILNLALNTSGTEFVHFIFAGNSILPVVSLMVSLALISIESWLSSILLNSILAVGYFSISR